MSEQTQNLYHFWVATSVGVVLEGHLSVGLLDLGLSGGLLDTEHFVEFFVVYLLRGGIGIVATAGEASRHAIEKAVKEHIPVFCLDGSIYEKLLFLKKKIFSFSNHFSITWKFLKTFVLELSVFLREIRGTHRMNWGILED